MSTAEVADEKKKLLKVSSDSRIEKVKKQTAFVKKNQNDESEAESKIVTDRIEDSRSKYLDNLNSGLKAGALFKRLEETYKVVDTANDGIEGYLNLRKSIDKYNESRKMNPEKSQWDALQESFSPWDSTKDVVRAIKFGKFIPQVVDGYKEARGAKQGWMKSLKEGVSKAGEYQGLFGWIEKTVDTGAKLQNISKLGRGFYENYRDSKEKNIGKRIVKSLSNASDEEPQKKDEFDPLKDGLKAAKNVVNVTKDSFEAIGNFRDLKGMIERTKAGSAFEAMLKRSRIGSAFKAIAKTSKTIGSDFKGSYNFQRGLGLGHFKSLTRSLFKVKDMNQGLLDKLNPVKYLKAGTSRTVSKLIETGSNFRIGYALARQQGLGRFEALAKSTKAIGEMNPNSIGRLVGSFKNLRGIPKAIGQGLKYNVAKYKAGYQVARELVSGPFKAIAKTSKTIGSDFKGSYNLQRGLGLGRFKSLTRSVFKVKDMNQGLLDKLNPVKYLKAGTSRTVSKLTETGSNFRIGYALARQRGLGRFEALGKSAKAIGEMNPNSIGRLVGSFKNLRGIPKAIGQGLKYNVAEYKAGYQVARELGSSPLKAFSRANQIITETMPGNLSRVSKGTGLLGKTLGRLAIPLMVLGEANDVINAKDKVKAIGKSAGGIGGSLLGAKAGAALGATIGTLILPGVGTVIGGAIGGIAGGVLGYDVGKKLGGKAIDLSRKGWDFLKKNQEKVTGAAIGATLGNLVLPGVGGVLGGVVGANLDKKAIGKVVASTKAKLSNVARKGWNFVQRNKEKLGRATGATLGNLVLPGVGGVLGSYVFDKKVRSKVLENSKNKLNEVKDKLKSIAEKVKVGRVFGYTDIGKIGMKIGSKVGGLVLPGMSKVVGGVVGKMVSLSNQIKSSPKKPAQKPIIVNPQTKPSVKKSVTPKNTSQLEPKDFAQEIAKKIAKEMNKSMQNRVYGYGLKYT